MADVSLPGKTAAQLWLRALTWVRNKAFSFPPSAWVACATTLLAAACAALLAGERAEIAAVLGAAALLPIGALVRWRGIKSKTDKPRVVLARFTSENPPFDAIATVHVRQIERRLRRHRALIDAVDLVVESVPMNDGQARRVLMRAPVIAVVSGSGLVVGGHARWDGWLLVRWPNRKRRATISHDLRDRRLTEAQTVAGPPERTALATDAHQPVELLTADVLDAAHAQAVEVTLLLAAVLWGELELDAAFPDGEPAVELPPSVATRLASAFAWAQYEKSGDALKAARRLEARPGPLRDEPLFWEWVQSMYMLAAPQAAASQGMIRAARHGLELDPDNLQSHANLAFQLQLTGHPDEALVHFYRALDLVRPDEPAHLPAALVSSLFLLGGGEDEWRRWQEYFGAIPTRDRPGVLAQLKLSPAAARATGPPAHFGHGPFRPLPSVRSTSSGAPAR